MKNPSFTHAIHTQGGLISSFVFENEDQLQEWVKNELPKLKKQYGKLTYKKDTLPGLKVGDTCRVLGEGKDTFVIESIVEYSPNRFGFVLDSGCTEEVVKCYSA